MKLKKLFEDLKRTHYLRKDYYIQPKVSVAIDDRHFRFFLLPTITFVPFPYIWTGSCCLEIAWLNIHICFGVWRTKVDKEETK